MGPQMDEQTMHTVITVLRQKLADLEWQNTLLQAEMIRLTNEREPTPPEVVQT